MQVFGLDFDFWKGAICMGILIFIFVVGFKELSSKNTSGKGGVNNSSNSSDVK